MLIRMMTASSNIWAAQNEVAAYSIQRACISKTSIPITRTFDATTDLNAIAWPGNFNTGFVGGGGYGLLVSIKNSTSFNITEVVVVVNCAHEKRSEGKATLVGQAII